MSITFPLFITMKTIIIGLGNPLLGDDSFGWRVAAQLEAQLKQITGELPQDIEVDSLAVGGLSLMERMVGFERAILIDSLTTGDYPVGKLLTFELEDLPDLTAEHMTNAHDTSLQTALTMGRKLGAELPSRVTVVGVEAKRVYDFSENLTPEVEQAIPLALRKVSELLGT